MRYLLITLVIVVVMVLTVGNAVKGDPIRLDGVVGSILPWGGAPKEEIIRRAPLFKFEVNPRPSCPGATKAAYGGGAPPAYDPLL